MKMLCMSPSSCILLQCDINYSVDVLSLQIQKGASSARTDDTKSLKGAVLDWITPKGQPLNPPLARNVKIDRGFHHERTGALLCPAGLNWSNSEYELTINIICLSHFTESRTNYKAVRWQCQAISGPSFCIRGTHMIQTIPGTAFSDPQSWCWYVQINKVTNVRW
jgi:hypothetical protein